MEAAKFTVESDVVVHSLEGWIGVSIVGSNGGMATAFLYEDGGNIPGEKLYWEDFFVPNASAEAEKVEIDWHGVHGQSWFLAAGTYWAGFEVHSYGNAKFLQGFMGGGNVPKPMEQYAFATDYLFTGGWEPYVPFPKFDKTGYRIDATTVVPLPSAMWLFVGSLLLLRCKRLKGSKPFFTIQST